jgi:3-mercaptopyruvate sulfurtransferase SseA
LYEKSQDNHNVLIVDMRTLDQSKKLTKHSRALSVGNIPGSIKFPVYGLYMDHAQLKSPQELLWVLKNRGITPDKTVVITCNTGAFTQGIVIRIDTAVSDEEFGVQMMISQPFQF